LKNRLWLYLTARSTLRRKIKRPRLCLLCFCIFIQACATQAPSPARVNDLATPSYAAQTNYSVNQAISEAQRLSQTRQFADAENIISKTLNAYPNDRQLLAAQKTYHDLNAREIKTLELEALIKRSLWLKSELRVQETVLINTPSMLKKWRINGLKEEQAQINSALLYCAQKYLSKGVSEQASQCLNAINTNVLSREELQQFQTLRNTLNQQSQKTARLAREALVSSASEQVTAATETHIQAQALALKEQLKNLEDALAQNDYKDAHVLAEKLRETNSKDKKVQQLLARADKQIHEYADRLSVDADQLYLQEKVAEADALWLQLMELDPNNPAYRQNHERAEKILKNIESIKQDSIDDKP